MASFSGKTLAYRRTAVTVDVNSDEAGLIGSGKKNVGQNPASHPFTGAER
jgi:hypothetical protein